MSVDILLLQKMLLMRASRGELCVCVSVLVCHSFIHSAGLRFFWGVFLCDDPDLPLKENYALWTFCRSVADPDCWACFKTSALESCQNIAWKKLATENSSSVLLKTHQSREETTDSSMGLMHLDPSQNLLLHPFFFLIYLIWRPYYH